MNSTSLVRAHKQRGSRKGGGESTKQHMKSVKYKKKKLGCRQRHSPFSQSVPFQRFALRKHHLLACEHVYWCIDRIEFIFYAYSNAFHARINGNLGGNMPCIERRAAPHTRTTSLRHLRFMHSPRRPNDGVCELNEALFFTTLHLLKFT